MLFEKLTGGLAIIRQGYRFFSPVSSTQPVHRDFHIPGRDRRDAETRPGQSLSRVPPGTRLGRRRNTRITAPSAGRPQPRLARERTGRMSVEVERKFLCGPDIQTRLNDLAAVCLGRAQFLDQYFDTPDCCLTLRDVWLRRRQGCWELKCRDGATWRRSAAESRQQERGGDALCTRYREITELAEVIARVREELREGDHEQAARVRDGQLREDGGGEGKCPASTETPVTGAGARLGTGSDIGQGHAEIPPTGSDIKTSDTEDPPTGSQVSGGEEENSSPSWVRELGLFPFAQFTTERCSYILPMEGEEEKVEGGGTRVDLDRADFGFCVGEIEVLVQSPEEMDSALRKIEKTAQRLGLSGDRKVPGKMDAYLQKFRPEHYGRLLSAHVL